MIPSKESCDVLFADRALLRLLAVRIGFHIPHEMNRGKRIVPEFCIESVISTHLLEFHTKEEDGEERLDRAVSNFGGEEKRHSILFSASDQNLCEMTKISFRREPKTNLQKQKTPC